MDSFPATFGLVFTDAIEHARTHTAKLAGDVTRTTLTRVTNSIHQGALEGLSMPHIAERIDDRLLEQIIPGQSRATVIARTETIRASNYGSQAAARGTGLTLNKVWLATLDGRQRETHAAANGQTKALDTPYDVGGWSLAFPGDPNGPGEETIQCRCTEYYEEDASAAAEPEVDPDVVEDFAPATNIKDAERYAMRQFDLDKVDYKQMSLDQANEMNHALTRLTRAQGVPKQWRSIHPMSSAVAKTERSTLMSVRTRSVSTPGGPTVPKMHLEYNAREFSPAKLRKTLEGMSNRGYTRGMLTVDDLVTHEFGHLLAGEGAPNLAALNAREAKFVELVHGALGGRAKARAVMNPILGSYSQSCATETWAEYFRAYHKRLLPDGTDAIARFFSRL